MLVILTLFAWAHSTIDIQWPTLARFAIESLDSRRAYLFYAALAGAPDDTLAHLNRDLAREFGASGLPRVTLENDELFVNDAASGVRVKTYEPFVLVKEGKPWTPLARAPIEMNAMSLRKAVGQPVLGFAGALLAAMVENASDEIRVGIAYGFASRRGPPLNTGERWIAAPGFQMQCDDERTTLTNDQRHTLVIDERGVGVTDAFTPSELIQLRKLRRCARPDQGKTFGAAIRRAAARAQDAIARTKR